MTEAEYLKLNLPLLVPGGAGAGAVGTVVDADVGYEDGAVEWCEEPEGDVCPDAE